MWKITDEQRFNVTERPYSFNNYNEVKSIRSYLSVLMDLIEDCNVSEAQSIFNNIDSELSKVEFSTNEFEEWGDGWQHVALDLDHHIKKSLVDTGSYNNNNENINGRTLVDFPSRGGLSFGNLSFKNFIEQLLPNAIFNIENNYPEQIVLTGRGYSTGIGFVKDGVCRYKNYPLIVDFTYLKATLNGVSYNLRDYFKDWIKPTQEEYDYFKMITDGHYWVRELYEDSEGYNND